MLAARLTNAWSGLRRSMYGRAERTSSGGDGAQLPGRLITAEAYDESTTSPWTAGPWSRITTPGSGPTFQRQATGSPAERHPGGPRGGRDEELDVVRLAASGRAWRRSSRGSRRGPGWVSSSTPHQEPGRRAQVERDDRPGPRIERELVERRLARERAARRP